MTNLTEIVGGKIVRAGGSSFLLVEKSLGELECGATIDYIEQHYPQLTRHVLGEHLPALGHMLKKKMLFCDIESSGPYASDSIISIALAHLGRSIHVSCAFARDYGESEEVLQYFMRQLESDTSLFTFNGNSYDLPRLNTQLRAKGILNGNPASVEEIIEGHHYDLYPLMSSLVKLRESESALEAPSLLRGSRRLQTFAKALFNEYREGDIPGRQIPFIYQDYLDGASVEEDMARIITHNMIDVVDLVALLTYYCLEPPSSKSCA